jgi:hypothetical protein
MMVCCSGGRKVQKRKEASTFSSRWELGRVFVAKEGVAAGRGEPCRHLL